jgi:hypothetical protein
MAERRADSEILEEIERQCQTLNDLGMEVLYATRKGIHSGPEVDNRRHYCHRLRGSIKALKWVLREDQSDRVEGLFAG